MKEETKLQKLVQEISETMNSANVSPEQARYIFKQVREKNQLQVPKSRNKLPDYLNEAEVWQLLKNAGNDPFDALLIEFLIFTGLRISECRNLMITDIDFQNNQLKVVSGKGAKDRHVPLGVHLGNKIQLYLAGRTKGYVFVKPKNKRQYCVRALQKKVKKQLLTLGSSKDLHTHTLRHTFACLCIAKGLQIQEISLLMGHTDIKTTQIYAKLELGAIKSQFLKLMDSTER